MEELRKEYKGLGLRDSQIIQAKSNGIKPNFIAGLSLTVYNMQEALDQLTVALNNIVKSNSIKKISEELSELDIPKTKYKNGKRMKCWQKNRFYE